MVIPCKWAGTKAGLKCTIAPGAGKDTAASSACREGVYKEEAMKMKVRARLKILRMTVKYAT